jgi:predicted DNA-binding protein (MmcQ/YjbR family)
LQIIKQRGEKSKKNMREEIYRYMKKKYKAEPEFLWKRFPDYAVFRHQDNRKWFALVMDVRRRNLGLDGEEIVDILNVKLADPLLVDLLIRQPGYFRGYHISRGNWISILLDDTVTDGKIMELTEESRGFALQAGKKERTGPVSWIVPANPKYYDVDAAFAEKDEILWKQGRGVRVGDTAYLYVAAPVSAVRYRCLVTETEIPYSFHSDEVSMTHVMKIRLEKTYPPEKFPMARLREMGMKTFQGVHPAPQAFLEEAEKEE